MTLDKLRLPARKGNEEIENDHVPPVSRMLWSCLKNFTTLVLDVKTSRIRSKE